MEANGLCVAIRPALLTLQTRCEALLAAHLRKPDLPRISVTTVHIPNSPSGGHTMIKRTHAGTFAVLLLSLSIACADAHPHVWVTFHSEVLYSAEGAMTGVRHAWTFDAVGPGHGKAVISSYLVANEETWRRGVVLSFASAAIQAVVAIVVVAIAAVLLGATAKAIGLTVHIVETVSYVLVILIGLRLLFVKGRGFLIAWRELSSKKAPAAAVASSSEQGKTLHRHDHGPDAMAMRCEQCHDDGHAHHVRGPHCHDHDHAHHASAWGHAHGPEPAELAGAGGWRRGLSAVVAVGPRPCSGAIIVLIFALTQDLFWTGVGATLLMGLGTAITVAAIATVAVSARNIAERIATARSGLGTLIMRASEAGAAGLIVAFGVLLLVGYMASEQLWMFTG
jgi:nickel/cobalt exporter